jgi:hypothetical protein
MGVYVYRTSRKHVNVRGLGKVYIAEYAFKPVHSGWDADKRNDNEWEKRVGPSHRAWERAGENPEHILMSKPEEGSLVYASQLKSFYDDHFQAPVVGTLAREGRTWVFKSHKKE